MNIRLYKSALIKTALLLSCIFLFSTAYANPTEIKPNHSLKSLDSKVIKCKASLKTAKLNQNTEKIYSFLFDEDYCIRARRIFDGGKIVFNAIVPDNDYSFNFKVFSNSNSSNFFSSEVPIRLPLSILSNQLLC